MFATSEAAASWKISAGVKARICCGLSMSIQQYPKVAGVAVKQHFPAGTCCPIHAFQLSHIGCTHHSCAASPDMEEAQCSPVLFSTVQAGGASRACKHVSDAHCMPWSSEHGQDHNIHKVLTQLYRPSTSSLTICAPSGISIPTNLLCPHS